MNFYELSYVHQRVKIDVMEIFTNLYAIVLTVVPLHINLQNWLNHTH